MLDQLCSRSSMVAVQRDRNIVQRNISIGEIHTSGRSKVGSLFPNTSGMLIASLICFPSELSLLRFVFNLCSAILQKTNVEKKK